MKKLNNIENINININKQNLQMKMQDAKFPATANVLNIMNGGTSKKFDSKNNCFSVLKKKKNSCACLCSLANAYTRNGGSRRRSFLTSMKMTLMTSSCYILIPDATLARTLFKTIIDEKKEVSGTKK